MRMVRPIELSSPGPFSLSYFTLIHTCTHTHTHTHTHIARNVSCDPPLTIVVPGLFFHWEAMEAYKRKLAEVDNLRHARG